MEEQYLAAIPVPVHSMEIDYNSAAEPDREFADSRLCTGEISDATTLEKMDRCSSSEWEKIWMYLFDTHCHPGENWSQEHQQVSSEPWETQKLLSKWKRVDLFLHRLCRPAVRWQRRPSRNLERQIHGRGRGPRTARRNRISVCPLRCIAAGPLFTFRGKKGSCARISPNCPHKLELPVKTLASLLCVGFCEGGLCGHEEFEKALAEIQHDIYRTFTMEPRSWSSMDWNASPRRGRAQQRGPPSGQGVCLVVRVLTRAVEYIQVWKSVLRGVLQPGAPGQE